MGQTPYKVPHQRWHKVVVASIWKDTSHPILWGKHKLEQWNTTMQLWKWQSLSCVQLCKPMDVHPPGSCVHGILSARTLEWVAIPFSKGIFLTQGMNLGLLYCRQILYYLSHQGRPNGQNPKHWEYCLWECKATGTLIHCCWKTTKLYSRFSRQFGGFLCLDNEATPSAKEK